MDNGTLIEIPVTTMPIFRLPMHVSYLMCLSIVSPSLAIQYFRAALKLCQWTATEPSIVLHPTDFLGCDDTQDLSFIPGMNLPSQRKLEFVSEFVRVLSTEFTVLTLQQHAQEAAQFTLPVIEAHFRTAANPEQQPV
jgi:hypothetical protein